MQKHVKKICKNISDFCLDWDTICHKHRWRTKEWTRLTMLVSCAKCTLLATGSLGSNQATNWRDLTYTGCKQQTGVTWQHTEHKSQTGVTWHTPNANYKLAWLNIPNTNHKLARLDANRTQTTHWRDLTHTKKIHGRCRYWLKEQFVWSSN